METIGKLKTFLLVQMLYSETTELDKSATYFSCILMSSVNVNASPSRLAVVSDKEVSKVSTAAWR